MAASEAARRPVPRREAFFGLHFDLHPQKTDTALGADASEENIRRLLDRVQPDYVQYDCKGHAGYTGYPTEVGWTSPGIAEDSLAIWKYVTVEFENSTSLSINEGLEPGDLVIIRGNVNLAHETVVREE